MSETMQPPKTIYHSHQHQQMDLGETIMLYANESPEEAILVGTIFNADDFPCVEDEDVEDVEIAAKAFADKLVNAYNNHDDASALIRELTNALEDLGAWLAYGLEKPDGADPTAEDIERCEQVAENAGIALAKGHRFLGNLGSCAFSSQVSKALAVERKKLEERQEKHSDAFYGMRGGDQC